MSHLSLLKWWRGQAIFCRLGARNLCAVNCDRFFLLLLLRCFSHVRLCATPRDGSPPGFPVPGILQARTLEWVATSFSNAWKWKVKVKSLSCVQLLATPGSSVHGIFQARVLDWGAIAFSSAWKWKVKAKSLSCVQLLATPWTAAHQAPPSMGFSRQEYWSGVPLPSPNNKHT